MKLVKLANNFHAVVGSKMNYWFSYETLIAFGKLSDNLYIIENQWSNTTARHLNMISDDKSVRLSKIEFEKAKKKFQI